MKKPLRKNSVCKVTAILAYMISMPVAIAGMVGTWGLYENGYYAKNLNEIQRTNLESRLTTDIHQLDADFTDLKNKGYFDENISKQRKKALYQEFMENYEENKTNFFFCIYDMNDNLLLQSDSGSYQTSRTYFHDETIWKETEQIMSEEEYQRFSDNHIDDELEFSATQMIVPRGEPAPTLTNQQNEAVPETESPAIETTSPTTEETKPSTTEETNPPESELPTTGISDATETIALAEIPFQFVIQAKAEEVPLEVAIENNSSYSEEEKELICNALGLGFYTSEDNSETKLWVTFINYAGYEQSILFEDYLQTLFNQHPDLRIITQQDGWHSVVDSHTDPPSLLPINQYIQTYPEEFSSMDSYPAEVIDSSIDSEPQYYDIYYDVQISEPETYQTHYIIGYVKAELKAEDSYQSSANYTALAYQYRYVIPAITILAGLLCIISFLFAVSSAGYHTDTEQAVETSFEKIPYDIFTVVLGIIGITLTCIIFDNIGSSIIIAGTLLPTWAIIILWWTMSTATRIRTKNILKNNILYKLFMWLGHALKKGKNKAQKGAEFVNYLPFVWKAGCIATGAVLLDIFSTVLIANGAGFGLMLKIFLWTVSIAGTIFIVYQLHLLEVGGQNLADGKLDEKIKEEKLFSVFKKHAQHLNSIGDGMNKAVSDRLKSEMFKTELIANVSHDIRTPLTSIINYTDLLSKLNLTDEKAIEYIDVLTRQSARLRKLTEDVLEASKATAGTMKTQKETMDVKVLLEQLIGEYAERFESKNLMLVSDIAETPLTVLADGRLLWRAMDNLFGNICKYAMPQTRVYLNAYIENHEIIITLRNISAVQLNISSDALMERFVRGDRSRNTEGSGLGLSIAQSFINLQGGELTLHIDGDLFKVRIQLPEQQV